jgi:hypothetical protein
MQLWQARRNEARREARERGREHLGNKCEKCGAQPKPQWQLRTTYDGRRRKRQRIEVSQLHAHHVVPATSGDMFDYLAHADWLPPITAKATNIKTVSEQLSKLQLLCAPCHLKLHQLQGKN